MKALKPCPFCGAEPFIDRHLMSYKIVCSHCLCYIQAIERDTAIERWNKRYYVMDNLDEYQYKRYDQK